MNAKARRDILTTLRNALAMRTDQFVLDRLDEADWLMFKMLLQKLTRPTYTKDYYNGQRKHP